MRKYVIDIRSPSERANNVAIGKSIIRAGKAKAVRAGRLAGRSSNRHGTDLAGIGVIR